MRLIQSETIFVDHCHDMAESLKTIVHESVGYHHIHDGLMWFKQSRYTRLKIEPNDDSDKHQFYRNVYGVLKKPQFKRVLWLEMVRGDSILCKKE